MLYLKTHKRHLLSRCIFRFSHSYIFKRFAHFRFQFRTTIQCVLVRQCYSARKDHYVLLLTEHKWVITVQRTFRRVFNKHHPRAFNITQWFHQFKETMCSRSRACEFQEHRLKLWKAFDNHLPAATGNLFALAVYKYQFQNQRCVKCYVKDFSYTRTKPNFCTKLNKMSK